MAISFTRTRNQLSTLVLGRLGVLAAGAAATSADNDLVYEAIDLRLKEAHKLGIFWRKVDKIPLSFTVTAGINSASASADVLFPITLHVADGSLDAPVRIISIKQYAGIENKADSGMPTTALWKGGAEFIFHPVPSTTTTAKLTYEKFADDTSASAAVDLDVSMLRSLRDMICYDLGDHFGKSEPTMARWEREAAIAERAIRKLGSERVDYSTVAVDDYERTPTDYPV